VLKFDPMMIAVLIQIILAAVKLIDDCGLDSLETFKRVKQRRPRIALWNLRRIIRREMPDADREMVDDIIDGLLTTTDVDAKQAIEEILQ
jgi:anti-anti-sigma regulatory factor